MQDLNDISRAAGKPAVPLGGRSWRLGLSREALVETDAGPRLYAIHDMGGFCDPPRSPSGWFAAAGDKLLRPPAAPVGDPFRSMLTAMAQLGEVGEPASDGTVPIRFGAGALDVRADDHGAHDVDVTLDGKRLSCRGMTADGLRALVAGMEAARLTNGETRRKVSALVETVVATAGRVPVQRLRDLGVLLDEGMAGSLDLREPPEWLHADVRRILHVGVARRRRSFVDQEAMPRRHGSSAGWLDKVEVHDAAVFYTVGVAVDKHEYVLGDVALSRPEDALVSGMLGLGHLLMPLLRAGTDGGLYEAATSPVVTLLRDPTADPRPGVDAFIAAATRSTGLEPELRDQVLFRARGVLNQWER